MFIYIFLDVDCIFVISSTSFINGLNIIKRKILANFLFNRITNYLQQRKHERFDFTLQQMKSKLLPETTIEKELINLINSILGKLSKKKTYLKKKIQKLN